jgi:hypothetical protein
MKSTQLYYRLFSKYHCYKIFKNYHTIIGLNPYTLHPSRNLPDYFVTHQSTLFHEFIIQPHIFFSDTPTLSPYSQSNLQSLYLHNESGLTAAYYNPRKCISSSVSSHSFAVQASVVPAAGNFHTLEHSNQENSRCLNTDRKPVRRVALWGMPDVPSTRERACATTGGRAIADSPLAFIFAESRSIPPEIQLFPLDRRPPENSDAEYLLLNPTFSFGFRGNAPISLHIRDFENELIQIWTFAGVAKSCFMLESIKVH